MDQTIFSTTYFGPISYYAEVLQKSSWTLEIHEHFIKQTYRNRCEIHGPNGRQRLIVPIIHTGQKQTMNEVKISHSENWQKLHWKSLESAYRSSAYFEFYEDQIKEVVLGKFTHLIELNLNTTELMLKLLGSESQWCTTESYSESQADVEDLRKAFNPKFLRPKGQETYFQVFDDRNGFMPDLSVLDLLFNLGPESRGYLERVT